MKTKSINPERMTTEQAAEYIGYAASTLAGWRNQCREDGPPYSKPGGKVFYRKSALDRWLDTREVNSVPG